MRLLGLERSPDGSRGVLRRDAVDLYDDALDVSGEAERGAVRFGDRQAAVEAAAEALAGRLDDGGDGARDLALADLLVVDVERANAAVLAGPGELESERSCATGHRPGRADPVLRQAQVVVDVV